MTMAQTVQITGTITGAEDKQPLTGATVLVKGTTTGVTTDLNGKYSINVPLNGTVLLVSYVGMKSQELVIAGRKTIDAELINESIGLEEVVVTALGITREKKALGYSVQDVKSEDINRTVNENVVNALGGKVSGLQVTSSAGVAGGSSFIAIRGRASLTGNNQPLFVVDGVPIDNSQEYSGNPDDGSNNLTNGVAYSNRAIDLNPDDIESISVLKGGAASALYGLRAANGVIVITTKKGNSTGGLKNAAITFNSSLSIDVVNKLPGYQTSYGQGSDGQWLGPDNTASNKSLSWGPLLDTMRYDGSAYKFDPNGKLVSMNDPTATTKKANVYNNPKNFFKTGATYTNSISISGGKDATNFYASYSNSTSKGIVPENDFIKNNFKITAQTKITDKLTISGSANYINSGGTRMQQGSNVSGVMLGLLRTPPSFDDAAGYQFSDGTQRNYRGGGGYDNPYWSVNKSQLKDQVNRLIGNIGFSYSFNNWIKLNYKLGIDYFSDFRKGFFDINSRAYPTGQVTEDHHFNKDVNSDLILNITHKISDNLNFSANLGQNMFQSYNQQLYVRGDGMTIPDFYHISNTSALISRESVSKKRTAALFADANIDYKNMLFLNGTYRQEWSTTLPEANNSFGYWSSSLGFLFTELSALKGNSILSFGKLRASYAIVANDAPAYSTITTYSLGLYNTGTISGISFPFKGVPGFIVGDGLGNSELKPEKLKSFEIGTELKFFNNRIGIDLAYYNNRNEDLILSVPVSGASGYITKVMNAGIMENKGIELMINIVPVKLTNFEWDITTNFTKNKNKVITLAPGVDNVGLGGFTGTDIRAVKGSSYGSIFASDLIRDKQGRVVIDDVKKLSDGTDNSNYGYPVFEDSQKEKELGSSLPDWTMGITNDLKYKNLELSFLFDIKHGGKMWNGTRGVMNHFGTGIETADRDKNYIFDGVMGHTNGTDPNTGDFIVVSDGTTNTNVVKRDQNWFQGTGSGFNGAQSLFVEDASWVRLKELSLSYALAKKLLEKSPVKGISLTFSARNLWLSTKYKGVDPETNLFGASNSQGIDYFNMPSTKTYTFGIKLLF